MWRRNSTLAFIIGILGLVLLAQWIYNIAHRIAFPFPIEYIEDAIFFQALRICHGLPIYIDPNDGYAALIYTPGYFYLLAGLFKLFDPSIITARFLSLACTIGIMALLIKVSISRLRFPLSIVPICVYLSLPYAYFAGYQDLGRVDNLMALMIFGGLYLLSDDKAKHWRIFVGVILLTLAFYVKQPAMAYLYFLYIFLYIRFKRTGFIAILISFAFLVGIFFTANFLTGGWFGFYTWELPMTHTYDWSVTDEVFIGGSVHATYVRGMVYLTLAIIAFIIFRLFTLRRERVNVFEATLPGALIATIGPFLKEGGYFQDLIPLHTHLCFLLPYALSIPLFSGKEAKQTVPAKRTHLVTSVILFFLILHCVIAITPLEDFKPEDDNIRLGWDFVDEVRKIEGEVFMPTLSYYGWLAGKEPDYLGASLMDLEDIIIIPLPLAEDLKSGRYTAILLPYYFDPRGYIGDLTAYSLIPTQLISFPPHYYELSPTIELPPYFVYWKKDGKK